ncbi:Reticulon-like protein [Desmophyllum pertusum]|uniref:Reticulon-like protein n=1 Tax=Desmophyllum pertusum TaxID=174260 RepID=A0A9W9ZRJ6_9CNID|nr:Reticulon-like protein [Desmophyllum pertusum]
MSESNLPESQTNDLLDFAEDEDVSSTTTPGAGFEDPTKDVEEPTPESEYVPDEKEETPAVEDLPTEKTESEEKSEETAPKEFTSRPARWMKEHGVDQKVIDLIYWRCLKKTGIVFATGLVLLFSLTMYTFLSVVTFFSMALLTVSLLYRVGMTVMGAIQKTGTDNPFKTILERDVDIPKEKAVEFVEASIDSINSRTKELRRLFLVEDIVDSIKFGLLLWVLSYVGAWFSALTLVIIGFIVLFSVPRLYEDHQDKVDEYVSMARTQIGSIIEQAKSKLPAKLQKQKSS